MHGPVTTHIRLLAVLAGVLLAGALSAQATPPPDDASDAPVQSVSLEGLIRQALEKSPGLQAKKRTYEAARGRVISAWLPDDPEIGVDVEGQPDLFDFSGRMNNEYMVSQTIPFPTTLILRGQVAMREAQMAFQEYKEAERDTIWHIEQPYYELFLAKKTIVSLEEIRTLLEKLLQAARARYESNQGSQQDLLKVQIERAKADIELVDWREKEHLAEAHFSHLLNQSLKTRYAVTEESSSATPSLSRDELEQTAVRMRPELKALETGIKRAKASRLLAVTSWLPEVTGRIEARQFKGEDDIRERDTFIGITVPVWSLLKGAGGEWKAAHREVQAAEALYTEMKNETLLAVHEAYSKVKAAEYAVQTYDQLILPQARQQVDVSYAAYEAGRSDFLSLIDAQRMLRDVQIAQANARAEYELGLSNLYLAIGGKPGPVTQQGGSR
jgi:outer membrane protein TolC